MYRVIPGFIVLCVEFHKITAAKATTDKGSAKINATRPASPIDLNHTIGFRRLLLFSLFLLVLLLIYILSFLVLFRIFRFQSNISIVLIHQNNPHSRTVHSIPIPISVLYDFHPVLRETLIKSWILRGKR